ncbi:MAG: NINE protein [Clostridia bacterium]|nr:NINE protein [Clostridia bacterium]
MKYCSHCGSELLDEAVICPKCGCAVEGAKKPETVVNASPKSRLIALLLCFFVGGIGVHRFYVGKIGTGILWLLTGGCFGIGVLVDVIMIACGSFTDKEGKFVSNWNLD